MSKQNLGEFEQLVLLAVLRLGEESYSVPIVHEIAANTGREVTHATVYVALRRLEAKGLVTSRLGEATSQRGGRSKRLFSVQPEAVDLLRGAKDAFQNMWRGLEPLSS